MKNSIFAVLISFPYFLFAQYGVIDKTYNNVTLNEGANGAIEVMQELKNGSLLVGGTFSSYNHFSCKNLILLDKNGYPDPSFDFKGSGPNNSVNALAVQADGKILVAGQFTLWNGFPTGRIVRLNPDGSLDNSFSPGSGASNNIRSILIDEQMQRIYVGGDFTLFNGAAARSLAVLNMDGSTSGLPTLSTGFNGTVYTIRKSPAGKLWVGGSFNKFKNITVRPIVEIDANLNLLSSPNLSGEIVYSLDFTKDGSNQTLILSNVLNSVNLAMITAIDAESNVLMTHALATTGKAYQINCLKDGGYAISGDFDYPSSSFLLKSKGIIFYSSFNVSDPTQQHFGHNLNAVYVSENENFFLARTDGIIRKFTKKLDKSLPFTHPCGDTGFYPRTGTVKCATSDLYPGEYFYYGAFTEYNGNPTSGIVSTDINGTVIRLFHNTQLTSFLSQQSMAGQTLVFNKSGQIILMNGNAVELWSAEGQLVKILYNGGQGNTTGIIRSLLQMGEYTLALYPKRIVLLHNDVVVSDDLIPFQLGINMEYALLSPTQEENAFILFAHSDNPGNDVWIERYKLDGTKDAAFSAINYQGSRLSFGFTPNNIYTFPFTNKLVKYDLSGGEDKSFIHTDSLILFTSEITEDLNKNVLIPKYGLDTFDNVGQLYLAKINALGQQEAAVNLSQFSKNSIQECIRVDAQGDIYMSLINEADSSYTNSGIIKIKGEARYDCGLLGLRINKTVSLKCGQEGYVKMEFTGGLPPFQYSINDSVISNIDSIVIYKEGYYKVAVSDATGCQRDLTFFVDTEKEGNEPDYAPYLVATSFVRGFENEATIVVRNKGCAQNNPSKLKLTMPGSVSLVSSLPAPSNNSGGEFQWNWDGSDSLVIHLVLKTATTASFDTRLILKLEVAPTEIDANPTDNSIEYSYPVVGSFDPNDLRAHPMGACNDHYITPDNKIVYTVRFQNTGNFPAQFVHVVDSLPQGLDLTSLRIIQSSHPMNVVKVKDQILRFEFPNIQLPGKDSDEANSQGHVIFELSMLPDAPYDVRMNNAADIYFDFNEAVKTNKVYHTLASYIPFFSGEQQIELCFGSSVTLGDIKISADTTIVINTKGTNGCDSTAYIKFKFKAPIDWTVSLLDNKLTATPGYSYQWGDCETGALIPGATSNEYIPSQSGLYFAIVSDGICQDASRCIPVTILSSTDNVSGRPSIFPNPIARDGVLQIRNLSSGKVSFSIRDYKGQILQAWSVPVEEKTEVSVAGFAAGMYILQIQAGDKNHLLQFTVL